MTSPAVRSDIQFNIGCSAAICEEIGDRLRITLAGAPNGLPQQLPQHMTMLVEQIARTDGVNPASRHKRNRNELIKLARPAAGQLAMLPVK
jgi:hypothetical protein